MIKDKHEVPSTYGEFISYWILQKKTNIAKKGDYRIVEYKRFQ